MNQDVKCTLCGHEWYESRYHSYRQCPSCRDMIDLPDCRRAYTRSHPAAPQPIVAPTPPTLHVKDGKLPPIISPALDPTTPRDHSYLGHNPWKEVALAAKKLRIDLP